jgi:hypothetical protein
MERRNADEALFSIKTRNIPRYVPFLEGRL